MKSLHFSLAAAILASGCTSLSPTEDPTALRMTDLEARVIRMERVVENQSLVQLASEVEMLRSETTALRGEIETLRFETENSDDRQRELYVDVDRRLQALETSPRAFEPPPSSAPSFGAPAAAGAAAAGAAVAARPAGSDQQNYDAAFALLQARKYEESAAAFETFLTQFPTSPRADNAVYWLAETHYVRGQYRRRSARVSQGHRGASAVRQGAGCAAEGRVLPERDGRSALRRGRRCKRSCASTPTRRPRGSRRSGSTACRNRERRVPWPQRRNRSLPARG